MSKGAYIGVSSKARKVKKAYIGVGGKARKVKKAYIGDSNGKARLWWSGGLSGFISIDEEYSDGRKAFAYFGDSLIDMNKNYISLDRTYIPSGSNIFETQKQRIFFSCDYNTSSTPAVSYARLAYSTDMNTFTVIDVPKYSTFSFSGGAYSLSCTKDGYLYGFVGVKDSSYGQYFEIDENLNTYAFERNKPSSELGLPQQINEKLDYVYSSASNNLYVFRFRNKIFTRISLSYGGSLWSGVTDRIRLIYNGQKVCYCIYRNSNVGSSDWSQCIFGYINDDGTSTYCSMLSYDGTRASAGYFYYVNGYYYVNIWNKVYKSSNLINWSDISSSFTTQTRNHTYLPRISTLSKAYVNMSQSSEKLIYTTNGTTFTTEYTFETSSDAYLRKNAIKFD